MYFQYYITKVSNNNRVIVNGVSALDIAIIDASEIICPVYAKYFIDDDGNLLHNCVSTAMYSIFISNAPVQAKQDQLLNDLHGYLLAYTTPSYEIVLAVAKAIYEIVNRLIKPYAKDSLTTISVLNATRTPGGYTLRIGYY